MKREQYLQYLALAALLVAFFGFFATAVWDVDFWWHIASGKQIVETRSLPNHDPFLVYETAGVRSETVLKSYWIAQVFMYLVVSTFGIEGIIVFKAALLSLCLFIVYLRARSLGSHPLSTFFVLFLIGMTTLKFNGERPQLFSFLFVSLVFWMIDTYTHHGKAWRLYLVPGIMILWANCHGGVVLGSVLLILFVLGHQLEKKIKVEDRAMTTSRLLLAVVGAGVILTLISPSGWNTYLTVLQMEGSELQKRGTEYMSPLALWKQTGYTSPYYVVLMALSLFSVYALFQDRRMSRLFILVFLGVISLTAYRYIPFYIFAAGPYIAVGAGRMMPRMRLVAPASYLAISLAALFALTTGMKNGTVFQQGINEQRFPAGAVQFLQQQGMQGRMFNSLEWGGYLLWNIYPQVRPFIDGRTLDLTTLTRYTHILWTTREGLDFFEQGKFDLVLIPYANSFTGERYTLNSYLLTHSQWHVLYQDSQGQLFGRTQSRIVQSKHG